MRKPMQFLLVQTSAFLSREPMDNFLNRLLLFQVRGSQEVTISLIAMTNRRESSGFVRSSFSLLSFMVMKLARIHKGFQSLLILVLRVVKVVT